jgi:hypothetical protein
MVTGNPGAKDDTTLCFPVALRHGGLGPAAATAVAFRASGLRSVRSKRSKDETFGYGIGRRVVVAEF